MKLAVYTFDNKQKGEMEVSDEIFAAPFRADILQRVVEWQRSKARAGTHKTKGISDISGTTAKPWKQKGTGRARQGSLRSPQFRGGAVIFGPVVRSHEYDLPKKVRKLGLRIALSSKQASGKLVVIKDAGLSAPKTKELAEKARAFGWSSALIIDGPVVDKNLLLAARSTVNIDAMPSVGANVYDILRHDTLVLTEEAVKKLEERLK